MDVKVKITLEFNKEQLCNAISNALYSQFQKDKRKVAEMTMYDLSTYLPDIIANEIINDMEDIIIPSDLQGTKD